MFAARFPLIELSDKVIIGQICLIQALYVIVVRHATSCVGLLATLTALDGIDDFASARRFKTGYPLLDRDSLWRHHWFGLHRSSRTHVSI